MPRFLLAVEIAAFSLLALGNAAGNPDLSPIYTDNIEFVGNASNIIGISWDALRKGLASPASVSAASTDGFDWTKPYPGEKIAGHRMYLTVVRDVPVPEEVVQNATTTVTTLTYGLPDSMMTASDTPALMDTSWYICRAIFIGVKPEAKTAVGQGKGCGFLSDTCQDDLKNQMTKDWGKNGDTDTMCSLLTFDPIPKSCRDSFGYTRAVAEAFDSTVLANKTWALDVAINKPEQYQWRIGTGFHEKGDASAYRAASNRTYLVATAWGYSKDFASTLGAVPKVSLSSEQQRNLLINRVAEHPHGVLA